jgi:hypothetical protein
VRGGQACDVCATARSSQQLQGHDRNGTGPRSGGAMFFGPISKLRVNFVSGVPAARSSPCVRVRGLPD